MVRCSSPNDPTSGPGPAAAAVRSTLTAALALLLKRGWIDPESQQPNAAVDTAFFQVQRGPSPFLSSSARDFD